MVGRVHVWDNGSSDSSVRVAGMHRARLPLEIHAAGFNMHHGPALDRLLRACCSADWVLVLDADAEIQRDAVSGLLPRLTGDTAFAGQINPHWPRLYAYLAHILINRRRYLTLPPFRHHGAPGLDYFEAVERARLPYLRVRWSDAVRHYGQASLRGLVARAERGNPLYAFAVAHAGSAAGVDDEQRLVIAMRDALEEPAASNRDPAAAAAPATPDGARRSIPRRAMARAAGWAGEVAATLRDPRAAAVLRRARRHGMIQQRDEIRWLAATVRAMAPRCVLEIGTSHGGTFFVWTRVAADDATLVSVDLPPWELDDPAEPLKVARLRGFARARQRIHLIRATSHDPSTRDRVVAALGGRPVDVLFIDGDHSYEGVCDDFERYAPLVRSGGLVAFHDIHPHSRGWSGDVWRFWTEVRTRGRVEERIADLAQDGYGIGAVWMP